MRLVPLTLLAALAAGCTPKTEAALGGFVVRWQEAPAQFVVVKAGSPEVELLRSHGAPLGSRKGEHEWETSFGSYKLTENDVPWSEAATLTATAEAARVVLDFGGGRKVTLQNATERAIEVRLDVPEADDQLRARFACHERDLFLGLGSHADDVTHRGHKVPVWTSEPGIGKTDRDDIAPEDPWFLIGTRHAASYPLPVFVTPRGGDRVMGFVADTTRRAVFDLCKADPASWTLEAWDHTLTLRLHAGSPAEVLDAVSRDVGRQPRANDLALAPWNDAIFGSAKVREVAALLRRERIPSGSIWTEDFRGGALQGENYRLEEEWDVDRALYPDVEALANELHAQGFRWLAYHNTFLNSGTRVLEEGRTAGVVPRKADGSEYLFQGVKFKPATLVDLSHPAGPGFVIERLKKLVSYGFDGWMADYGEWLPPDAVLANGDAEEQHNDYPRQYHAAVMEALKAHPAPEYATSFARSGGLGAPPHQPVVWAGDQWTNMMPDDGLATVVTMGLNLGLAGIGIYGHDIAGYQNGTYGPSTKETFFRWTTVGALSPVMRTHHGTKAVANWWFGKDAETIAHFRRWAQWHARSWPYLRAAADVSFATGMPMMRLLGLAFPAENKAWTIKDEYLLGDALLVAPVMTEGATSRALWLPPGRWVPFFGGAPLEGNRELTVDVPLTEAPLYARAGTIYPMLPERLDTLMPAEPPLVDLDDVRAERTLHLFAGSDGKFTDLDGTTYALAIVADGTPDTVSAGDASTFDTERRTVTVTGQDLASVEFRAGDKALATFTKTGATKVTELVLHY